MGFVDGYGLARVWTKIKEMLNNKQDKLTAGNGISINNNVISATGGTSGGNATWSSWYEVPMYYENSKWSSVDVFPQLWSADPLEIEIYFQIINPDNSNWTLSQVIKIPTLVYEENVSGLYINLGEICASTNNNVNIYPQAVMGNIKAYIENGHIKAVDDSGGWCGDYCSLKCFYRCKSV